jgi:hypothetical protein
VPTSLENALTAARAERDNSIRTNYSRESGQAAPAPKPARFKIQALNGPSADFLDLLG